MTDPNLTPLEDLYQSYIRLGKAADWIGAFDAADRYYKKACEYKRRLEAGEIYEPNF